jgi:hypothetical protein
VLVESCDECGMACDECGMPWPLDASNAYPP